MSTVGQVDPKIQALFDENLATTRSANAAVTAKLKADQDRLAAEAKAREEKHQKDVAASLASAQDVARHGDQQRKPPQWQQRDRSAGEMAFGPEDDEGGYFTHFVVSGRHDRSLLGLTSITQDIEGGGQQRVQDRHGPTKCIRALSASS